MPLLALCGLAHAGQPIDRFRNSSEITFSQGSVESRYGNADGNVKVTLNVFILGNQVFNSPSSSAEAAFTKASGTLDFSIKLSDFDPTLPPDTVTLLGQDLGNDAMRHTANTVLPDPYHLSGNFNGTAFDLTVSNVQVTGNLLSQCSNAVVPPWVNPVLGKFCDVQFDDAVGANNMIVAIPANVSGWVVDPLFTVRSVRVDVTGIQQAGQVPARVIKPTSFDVRLGRATAGNATSLGDLDSDALTVCKFLVPNQQVAPINVEVNGTVANVPGYLSFYSSSRMTVTGVFQQTLDLYDFNAGAFSAVDSRTDGMSTDFNVRKLDATGNVARCVGPNGEVKARYRVKQTGPASSNAWCADHDFAAWTVTP